MELKTIQSKLKKDITVSEDDLLNALSLDSTVWTIHGAYVGDTTVVFGVSERNPK